MISFLIYQVDNIGQNIPRVKQYKNLGGGEA